MALDSNSSPQDCIVAMHQTADRTFPFGQSLAPTSDEYLVAAAQSGNLLAFAELRSRHALRMRRLLYGITKNWDDADDALQDCFFKVFMKLEGFENRFTFTTWLTTVVINSGLAILRKRRKQREIPLDGGTHEERSGNGWEMWHCAEDPEAYTARREREELLRQAILRLPPFYRTVVELRDRQEYSIKEISERLCISLPATKSRLLRARKALRTSLIERHGLLDSSAPLKQGGSQMKGTRHP